MIWGDSDSYNKTLPNIDKSTTKYNVATGKND